MTPDPTPGDDFDLARRALRSIGGGQKKKESPKSPPDAESRPAGDDMLGRLVGALKAGSQISALEPAGYGHFEGVRTGARTLNKGMRGDAIDALQQVLRKLGVENVPDNGRFDDATEAALRRFQEGKGACPVTGIVDPATVEAFDRALGLPERRPASETEDAPPPTAAELNGLPDSGNEFIDRIAPGAIRGMRESGIPASVSIAMAVLESDWGGRTLARDYNNLFGLRGSGTAGSVPMDESGERPGGSVAFRRYDDPCDSVADHAKLVATSEQYKVVMPHASHPDNFARALSGVYSPNPNYGSLVVRIMKQFDLYRYDRVPGRGTKK